MDGFELAVLFTAAGALVGGAFVKVIVSAGKAWGIVPEHGRGALYAAGAVSALLMGLAAWDADFLRDGVTGQDVLTILLSWANLYAASVGIHETAVKVESVARGSTNPVGPDS